MPEASRKQARRLAAAFAATAAQHPGDEAGFRAKAERALEEIASENKIELDTQRELTLTRGRADAVFNRFIVEWEPPGRLAGHSEHTANKHAVKQLRDYLDGLAERERREVERLAGAACDGRYLIFARYRARRWIVDEPVPVDARSVEQLLRSLFAAHSGRALTAENLIRDFSGGTLLARQLSRALLDQLNARLGHAPDGLTGRLYRQWETLFAVATGVIGEADQLDANARDALARVLGVPAREIEPARALFAIQTYFAIVTKLIALLAVSLFVEEVEFDLAEMAAGGDADLWEDMEALQRGEPFRAAGLANVVEPDVFDWYLDWTDQVRDGVRALVGRLKDYDPATLQVSPEDARDLLKDLYQGLLPRPVRHALGQYFTPDWLAEQLLQQAKYAGDPSVRLVDPACGTGTFLVLAIARLKDRLRRDRVPDRKALPMILHNVVGFDIDPLAAVAARANYVLALGPLLGAARGKRLDIPVYLADSVLMPALGETLFTGDRIELETAAGTFSLPRCIDTEDELRGVCDLASEGLELGWDEAEFVRRAARVCKARASERRILAEFFAQCRQQHDQGLDGLWPRILRNAFMPAFIGRFDLVVGNPPWVNWESLPRAYRERTRPLWERSGLFVHGGMDAMLGSGKKDVAMLMSYVATDRLLKERGRLAFVVTQTVFKTAGAGQGYRRFRVGDGGPDISVEQVDDMVDLNPFVGATNRTALVTWRRDARTAYPVRYLLWQRARRGMSIPLHAPVDEVVGSLTRRLPLVAAPVRADDPTSAWLTVPEALVPAMRKLAETGKPAYEAHAGVYSGGANGIYWVALDGPADSRGQVPVTNLHDVGKKKLPKRYGRIERELLHPLVRGSDVSRWSAVPSAHILFVQDPETRRGIDEKKMQKRYPGALEYLLSFEQELRARAAFKRYFNRNRKPDEPEAAPYWSMFDVGGYTLAEHKVVWKDQAQEFTAAVLDGSDPVPLPNHKVMLVACSSGDEAHFLCAALNSLAVRVFVASYAVETQISTHTVKTIRVPKYDRRDSVHVRLAKASRTAHGAVERGGEPDEEAVDVAAAALWGLTAAELDAMRSFLDQLHKRDLPPA